MVTIHPTERLSKAADVPVMPVHKLQATKDTLTFKKGDIDKVFIQKMLCGRFAIMDANFANWTRRYEVHTEESLHESFTELSTM